MSQASVQYEKKADHDSQRISQGDIIADLKMAVGLAEGENDFEIVDIPFLVVLSQECDLEQDFELHGKVDGNGDKIIPTVLVCPAYNFAQFQTGDHYVHLNGKKMRSWNKNEALKLATNTEHERYHKLIEDAHFSIPDLVIDFKHFYTVPRDVMYSIYKNGYKASIKPLFREHVSRRFANYLSRIGLPNG